MLIERCAGIDIGKKTVAVTIRTPGQSKSRRRQETRTFGTVTGQVLALRNWLVEEAEINDRLKRFCGQLDLLMSIPGVARRTAEVIIAETGGDMSVFGSPHRLAACAGVCPGSNESADKHRPGHTREGNKWLGAALVESAHAAGRTKGTYLAAQYWRLSDRRGKKRAAVAVGHSILVIAYHLLGRNKPYTDLGGDYFTGRLSDEVHVRHLVVQLERLRHRVTLEPTAPPAA